MEQGGFSEKRDFTDEASKRHDSDNDLSGQAYRADGVISGRKERVVETLGNLNAAHKLVGALINQLERKIL